MYNLYYLSYNPHPLSAICNRCHILLFPIVYQWTLISKLSSVGVDYIKYYTDGHLKMVILLVILLVILFPNLNLVILFTPLRGTQLPPLSEEPYAPMGIKINASKEYARPLDGLVILLVYSNVTTTLLNSRITARKERNNATRKSSR